MPWGRLDDQLHQNEKVLSFSDKAFRVWMYSISYCNAKRARDPVGTLSIDAAQAICRWAQARPAVRDELVAKGGWERSGDGYVVHDFDKYGPGLDRTNAQRQKRYRNAHRDVTAESDHENDEPRNVSDNGTVTRYGNDPVPVPVPVPSTASPTESLPQQETPVVNQHMAISRSPRVGDRPPVSSPGYPLDFEHWWHAYPRHEAKAAAFKSYQARLKSGRSAEQLYDAAEHLAAYVDEHGTPTDKIPHATTFLNQRRDEDWEHGPPDAHRVVAPRQTGPEPKLAQTAAGIRRLKHLQELNGDKRTSFFDLATSGVGLPDAGRAGPDPRALPGPPGGAALA